MIILVLIVGLYIALYRFSTPKSSETIIKYFDKEGIEVSISTKQYREFKYRTVQTKKVIDTTLPTMVFVHGSIGSSSDFKKYLTDKDLNSKANLMSYDRVGYGIFQTGEVQESIEFEKDLLEDFIKEIPSEKVILVGYSYGGPISLASNKKYKSIVLLAPAVSSKFEPMPWAINFYKWKLTRWMVPKTWRAASKEKISHASDLTNFENDWNLNPNKITAIHGDKDWIVPFENSLYLENKFSNKNFELITLKGAGHGLVWSKFNEIKSILLQQLN